MSKEKTFFFFSLTALFLNVYLSQFFLTLSIFLLLTQFLVLTFCGTSLFTLLQMAEWPYFIFLHPFLPSTCLTSLPSHLHLCGLTFVHHFINVVELLYIIIEKKMNSILLFWSSYSCKTHFILFLFSSFNVSHKFNITSPFMWHNFCTSIEKKMNPILLVWSSYYSKTHFTLLTSQHLSNKLI